VFLSSSRWTVCCGSVTSPANHKRLSIHDQAGTSAEDKLRYYKFEGKRIKQTIIVKGRFWRIQLVLCGEKIAV
jgi:hypothetical protein